MLSNYFPVKFLPFFSQFYSFLCSLVQLLKLHNLLNISVYALKSIVCKNL